MDEVFFNRSFARIPPDLVSPDLVMKAFSDSALEDTAIAQAEQLFSARNLSEVQLSVGRNWAGAGYFQQLVPTIDDRGVIVETDSSGNRVGPIDVLEQWRYDERFGCKSAFARDIDD